jgi:hypothetical protein
VVGSSLAVWSAFRLAKAAKAAGASCLQQLREVAGLIIHLRKEPGSGGMQAQEQGVLQVTRDMQLPPRVLAGGHVQAIPSASRSFNSIKPLQAATGALTWMI